MEKIMQLKYRLYRRSNGSFYWQENDGPKQGSLRTKDKPQAAYFGIELNRLIDIGKQASDLTRNALAKPFTVYTRWRLALGRSKLPRYYALIETAEGKDLNELLVSAGLARIYGVRTAGAGWTRFEDLPCTSRRIGSPG
jgi:endonuclease YncB( thermonuclease family)